MIETKQILRYSSRGEAATHKGLVPGWQERRRALEWVCLLCALVLIPVFGGCWWILAQTLTSPQPPPQPQFFARTLIVGLTCVFAAGAFAYLMSMLALAVNVATANRHYCRRPRWLGAAPYANSAAIAAAVTNADDATAATASGLLWPAETKSQDAGEASGPEPASPVNNTATVVAAAAEPADSCGLTPTPLLPSPTSRRVPHEQQHQQQQAVVSPGNEGSATTAAFRCIEALPRDAENAGIVCEGDECQQEPASDSPPPRSQLSIVAAPVSCLLAVAAAEPADTSFSTLQLLPHCPMPPLPPAEALEPTPSSLPLTNDPPSSPPTRLESLPSLPMPGDLPSRPLMPEEPAPSISPFPDFSAAASPGEDLLTLRPIVAAVTAAAAALAPAGRASDSSSAPARDPDPPLVSASIGAAGLQVDLSVTSVPEGSSSWLVVNGASSDQQDAAIFDLDRFDENGDEIALAAAALPPLRLAPSANASQKAFVTAAGAAAAAGDSSGGNGESDALPLAPEEPPPPLPAQLLPAQLEAARRRVSLRSTATTTPSSCSSSSPLDKPLPSGAARPADAVAPNAAAAAVAAAFPAAVAAGRRFQVGGEREQLSAGCVLCPGSSGNSSSGSIQTRPRPLSTFTAALATGQDVVNGKHDSLVVDDDLNLIFQEARRVSVSLAAAEEQQQQQQRRSGKPWLAASIRSAAGHARRLNRAMAALLSAATATTSLSDSGSGNPCNAPAVRVAQRKLHAAVTEFMNIDYLTPSAGDLTAAGCAGAQRAGDEGPRQVQAAVAAAAIESSQVLDSLAHATELLSACAERLVAARRRAAEWRQHALGVEERMMRRRRQPAVEAGVDRGGEVVARVPGLGLMSPPVAAVGSALGAGEAAGGVLGFGTAAGNVSVYSSSVKPGAQPGAADEDIPGGSGSSSANGGSGASSGSVQLGAVEADVPLGSSNGISGESGGYSSGGDRTESCDHPGHPRAATAAVSSLSELDMLELEVGGLEPDWEMVEREGTLGRARAGSAPEGLHPDEAAVQDVSRPDERAFDASAVDPLENGVSPKAVDISRDEGISRAGSPGAVTQAVSEAAAQSAVGCFGSRGGNEGETGGGEGATTPARPAISRRTARAHDGDGGPRLQMYGAIDVAAPDTVAVLHVGPPPCGDESSPSEAHSGAGCAAGACVVGLSLPGRPFVLKDDTTACAGDDGAGSGSAARCTKEDSAVAATPPTVQYKERGGRNGLRDGRVSLGLLLREGASPPGPPPFTLLLVDDETEEPHQEDKKAELELSGVSGMVETIGLSRSLLPPPSHWAGGLVSPLQHGGFRSNGGDGGGGSKSRTLWRPQVPSPPPPSSWLYDGV